MNRKPPSLRRNLRRALLTPVFVFAAGAAGYAAVSLLPATMVMAPPPAPAPVAPEPSVAEVLIEEHDCWTGAAPADMEGVVPGHVVMTLKNGKTVYHADRGVEAALQHVFDKPLPGITEVHAFCR